MKTTNKSTVEYVDHMGNDDSVVNSARVSFDKVASLYTKEQNEKLIAYLAKHNHWSPFAHTSITLRICAPVFVARQLVKHQVGLVWNEVSRRYVDEEPVFYFPDKWRKRADNVKQGSSDKECTDFDINTVIDTISDTLLTYNMLLEDGVAPEQARMVLPQNMMTTWFWTGSMLAFHRVFQQRTDPHAQKETAEVGHSIGEICNNLFPISWKALNGSNP